MENCCQVNRKEKRKEENECKSQSVIIVALARRGKEEGADFYFSSAFVVIFSFYSL
jgi:hypothetical protein